MVERRKNEANEAGCNLDSFYVQYTLFVLKLLYHINLIKLRLKLRPKLRLKLRLRLRLRLTFLISSSEAVGWTPSVLYRSFLPHRLNATFAYQYVYGYDTCYILVIHYHNSMCVSQLYTNNTLL